MVFAAKGQRSVSILSKNFGNLVLNIRTLPFTLCLGDEDRRVREPRVLLHPFGFIGGDGDGAFDQYLNYTEDRVRRAGRSRRDELARIPISGID